MIEIDPKWIDPYKRLKHDFWFDSDGPGRAIIAQHTEPANFSVHLAKVLPYKVMVDDLPSEREWMRDNLQGPWVYWLNKPAMVANGQPHHYVAFHSVDDATLFKLTWGGQ